MQETNRFIGITCSRLLLMTALLWRPVATLAGQTNLPQDGSSESASSAHSVNGLQNMCVQSDSDDTGTLFIVNKCAVAVETMWFFGGGNQGFASLAAGERASTGVTGAEIRNLGVLSYFACPATHPVISDANGQFVSAPVREYHCEIDTAKSTDSKLPKSFPYDVLTSGDCVLEKGELTFNANGQGQWRAKIHTNHTTNRDIWHMSFNVVESTGRPLFPVFVGDSPAMYGSPSPTIPWAVNFQFDPAKFRLISHVTMRQSC